MDCSRLVGLDEPCASGLLIRYANAMDSSQSEVDQGSSLTQRVLMKGPSLTQRVVIKSTAR